MHYSYAKPVKFVVMPNHIHILLSVQQIQNFANGQIISAPTASISTIIGQLKRWVSKQCGANIWQKSFYDHIVRSENDYLKIWTYIDENPLKWTEDELYV